MASIRHYYNPMDRDGWLVLRRQISGVGIEGVCRIGASDIHAALGRSQYKSPIRVFYELLGRQMQNFDTEKTANGLLIEEHIKNRYCYYSPDEEEHVANMMQKKKVNKVRMVNAIVVSDQFDYISASLDIERVKGQVNFFTGETMDYSYPIDLKNLSFYSNQSKNETLSEYYEFQLIGQMIASEAPYSELACMIDGWKMVIHPCYYDQDKVDYVKRGVEDFCKRVIAAKPLEKLYQDAKEECDFESMALYDSLISNLSPDAPGIEDDWKILEELQGLSEVDEAMLGDNTDLIYYNRYKKALRLEGIAKRIKDVSRAKLTQSIGEYKKMTFDGVNGFVSHYPKKDGKYYWSVK